MPPSKTVNLPERLDRLIRCERESHVIFRCEATWTYYLSSPKTASIARKKPLHGLVNLESLSSQNRSENALLVLFQFLSRAAEFVAKDFDDDTPFICP